NGEDSWRPAAPLGATRAMTLARFRARAFFCPNDSLTGGFMPRVSSTDRDIFDPAHERDACGVGFVADVGGRASHSILETAVYSLCRVRHRGAVDADGKRGDRAKATQPVIEQALFLKPIGVDAAEAERRCVRARKRAEKACAEVGIRVYFPSFSFSTITYKGMCLADKLADFYLDLTDERYQVPLAIFHQRFSTNTLPTWERTQPFRMLCHNGEINTIQ